MLRKRVRKRGNTEFDRLILRVGYRIVELRPEKRFDLIYI